MDAVRQRLAPIRGIPTKAGGMQVRAPPSLVHQGRDKTPPVRRQLLSRGMNMWAGDDVGYGPGFAA